MLFQRVGVAGLRLCLSFRVLLGTTDMSQPALAKTNCFLNSSRRSLGLHPKLRRLIFAVGAITVHEFCTLSQQLRTFGHGMQLHIVARSCPSVQAPEPLLLLLGRRPALRVLSLFLRDFAPSLNSLAPQRAIVRRSALSIESSLSGSCHPRLPRRLVHFD